MIRWWKRWKQRKMRWAIREVRSRGALRHVERGMSRAWSDSMVTALDAAWKAKDVLESAHDAAPET